MNGPITVLLVEGDTDSIRTVLEEDGIVVETADSAEEAASLIAAGRFDALISDIRLDGLSGIDLLSQVRELDPCFPVILMTDRSDVATAIDAVKLGAHDYILKPLEAADGLLMTLRKSVDCHCCCLENRELRGLLKRFCRMQEKARGDLARELHDQVGQMLVAMGMNLALIQNGLPDDASQQLSGNIANAREQLKNMNDRIRQVMGALRPPVLDDYGLVASLKWYGEQYSKSERIPVEVLDDSGKCRLPAESETAVFRMAQEAMTNIVQHASATHVLITILAKGNTYRVTITDDGVGFDTDEQCDRKMGSGLGLTAMRERVNSVGGRFAVKSSPGDGTQVIVEFNAGCRSK